eukprot:g3137.t1
MLLSNRTKDSDGDKKLNREELEMLLKNPKAVRTLADVGVDLLALVDLMDFIFEQNEETREGHCLVGNKALCR